MSEENNTQLCSHVSLSADELSSESKPSDESDSSSSVSSPAPHAANVKIPKVAKTARQVLKNFVLAAFMDISPRNVFVVFVFVFFYC